MSWIDPAWFPIHPGLWMALAGLSALLFVGSLIALPLLLARIPADYFADPRRHAGRLERQHPLAYIGLRVLKNLVGWILVAAGILMLVLPGQGVLTILTGLMLSDFPGKFALERRIAGNPRILNGINWIRRRSGRCPLLPPRLP